MLQGGGGGGGGGATAAGSFCQAPALYGQSHFKKFWLKKTQQQQQQQQDEYASSAAASVGSVNLSTGRGAYALSAAVRTSDDDESECCSGTSNYGSFTSVSRNNHGGVAVSSSRAGGRMCADCKTVKTPLWRNGPNGPKSLCNACGIRYKKLVKRPLERPCSPANYEISASGKRRQQQKDLEKEEEQGLQAQAEALKRFARKKLKKRGRPTQAAKDDDAHSDNGNNDDEAEAALIRWQNFERIRRGLLRYGRMRSMAKDEEEGAVLLMALSCGVAF